MKWLIVACALLAAACSGDGSSTQTASPPAAGASSGVVEGPMPQSTALARNNVARQFVLDRETGEMWIINGGGATSWIDDTTLFAPFYPRGIRQLRLDGTSTYLDEIPPTPGARVVSTASADGKWQLASDGDASYIEENDGGRRIEVPANTTFAWSPRGHVLATGGGRCGNFPIVFVDPDSEPPTRVVDVGGRITRSYAWLPDGTGIALAVVREQTRRESQILFVTAADAAVRILVPDGEGQLLGEPIVGPWSPSGAHLLFGLYTGRQCPD